MEEEVTEVTHVSDVVHGKKLGGKSAMDAQELFVHDGGERKGAEGFHACIVYSFRVFVLA